MGDSVTTMTKGDYIQFMTFIIPIVMVVFGRGVTALSALALRGFGYLPLVNGLVKHFVGRPYVWVAFVPRFEGLTILRPVIATFVSIAILIFAGGHSSLASLRFSLSDYLPTSIFLFILMLAVFAMVSAPMQSVESFSEIIQRFRFAALSTSLFHKNASCQLGVSTFA